MKPNLYPSARTNFIMTTGVIWSFFLMLFVGITSCSKDESIETTSVNAAMSIMNLKTTSMSPVLYYGHETFTRGTGCPVNEVLQITNANFNQFTNQFTLNINNGTNAGNRVSSAVIKLDGVQIFGPSDFSQNVSFLTKPIPNLTANSILEVEVRGKPGGVIDLWVDGVLNQLLYIGYLDLDVLPGQPGSHSIEIGKWEDAGYIVDILSTKPPANTVITSDLLAPYKALRLTNYYPHYYTAAEGAAIEEWVNNGGKLLADIHYNADVNAVSAFGVDHIEGAGGGYYGLDWYYHGAPLVINPLNGPFSVGSVGIEAMDRPFLKSNHGLNIAASYSGYPVVVYKDYGDGKVIVTFDGGSYSLDVVHPGNAYRACINDCNNSQFIDNIIAYFGQ